MSKSPVKFVGAAARTVSGGSRSGYNTSTILADPRYAGVFGNKKERRRARAQRKANRAAAIKRSNVGYADMMRNEARNERLNALSSDPAVEINNSIDNTVSAAQDRSQMRDTGELTGVAGPAGFSTMSSDVLDPMSQLTPSIDNSLQPQVPTYGVAGAAETMFGTPMQRQMSMGSSLMKRACKYKNKK